MESYAAAFGAWKSAQSRLESAIQESLDACVTLRDVFAVPPLSASSHQFKEEKFTEIDLELQSFPPYTGRLSAAQNCLSLARNTSCRLSPICVLPSDLLHMVLCHTVEPEVIQYPSYVKRPRNTELVTLSGVCSTWRHLMLHSTVFWKSVELVLAGTATAPYYELARLWAERSCDAPLDLLLYGFEDSTRAKAPPHNYIGVVSEFVTTLLPRVRTLELCAYFNLNELLYPIIYRWATHGTAGAAQRLYVYDPFQGEQPDSTHLEISNSMIASTYTDARPPTFADFFCSLDCLSVYNPSNVSNLPIHAGLVELCVESWEATIWQIHRVLTATPRLRVLRLTSMTNLEVSSKPADVPLNHLKTLMLHGGNTWRVLDFLTTTSRDVKVWLLVLGGSLYPSTVRSFLTRTNVSHLYLKACYPSPSLSFIFTRMPYLRVLGLDGFHLLDLGPYTIPTPSDDLWPALHDIYLMGGDYDSQALEQLISIHVPQAVRQDEYSLGRTSARATKELLSRYGIKAVQIPSEGPRLGDIWR